MTDASIVVPQSVAPEAFRTLMSEFPTGVAVVMTYDRAGRPWGMTCSSLCSLSVTPPTLLVCLRRQSPTLAALLQTGTFAVNLLHGDARAVGELFSSGAADRFDRVSWRWGGGGPHVGQDTHAIADCRVVRTADGGTHVIVFGEVFAVTTAPGRSPLLYGRQRYSTWSDN
ncbi:flavin reductase family protein [Streptomyces noboritoensis]|uniref:Flavin reductase family protein n=1 Tax=Streptomyces noboritoensis TaxID=67337 RepID=A0ABV6TDF2_9ACTN